MENVAAEASEVDQKEYQEDTSYVQTPEELDQGEKLPKVLAFGRTSNGLDSDKANMLNEFFISVFTPKHEFCIKEINNENPTVTNFSV